MTGRKKTGGRKKSVSRQKTGSRSLPVMRAPRQVQDQLFDGIRFSRALDTTDRDGALVEADRWRSEGQLAEVTQDPKGEKFTVWLNTPDQETKIESTRAKGLNARLNEIKQGDHMAVTELLNSAIPPGRKWWELERQWCTSPEAQAIAKADYHALWKYAKREGVYDYYMIRQKYGRGSSRARDELDMNLTRAFFARQTLRWDRARLAGLAAELEDTNNHPMAGYIRHVEIGGIPFPFYKETWQKAEY